MQTKFSHISRVHILKSFSGNFHIWRLTKILADFQICIGISLTIYQQFNWHLSTCVLLVRGVKSKLKIKAPERRQWRRFGVFVNFEHISHHILAFLLLTLSRTGQLQLSVDCLIEPINPHWFKQFVILSKNILDTLKRYKVS